MKFQGVKLREIWPVFWICAALGVSCGGFYAWLNRPESAKAPHGRRAKRGHPTQLLRNGVRVRLEPKDTSDQRRFRSSVNAKAASTKRGKRSYLLMETFAEPGKEGDSSLRAQIENHRLE